jgi:cholesterol oxidase
VTRLSLRLEALRDHYEVVVVGSGYGGGIAASRLARAGRRVCVLERGREIQPGEYPATKAAFLQEVQLDLPGKRIGSPTALFDLRMSPDVNVIVGCGLGGTSLINANVALRAEPRIFADPVWPAAIRADAAAGRLDGFYTRAEEMLKPVPYPEGLPVPRKLEALAIASGRVRGRFYQPPIAVTFEAGPNPAGVPQKACVGCGDCVSGCNHGAKNTVLMNYLPDARNHGAEIFTGVEARQVERGDSTWRVRIVATGARPGDESSPRWLSADIVVLAAGTLGTTEILLRSAQGGLALSPALGRRFSGNGDRIGWTYNADRSVNGVGFGDRRVGGREVVGPCVTGIIDARQEQDVDAGKVMEEASMPGALAALLPAALKAGAKLMGEDTDRGLFDRVREKIRQLTSALFGAYTGAVRNTLTYLVVAHDASDGRLYLEDDRVRVDWSGAGKGSALEEASELMREASAALGGTYVKMPVWNRFTGQDRITGHPLGGCPMADDAASGVVNHKGQVYAGAAGTHVHPGLYVMDAAVIARSLGVNPFLTISALAERSCALLAADRGWTIPYDLPSRPADAPSGPPD